MAERTQNTGCIRYLPKFLQRFAINDIPAPAGKWSYSSGELNSDDPNLCPTYYVETDNHRMTVLPNGVIHTWRKDKNGMIIFSSMCEHYDLNRINGINLRTLQETELVARLLERQN